MKEHIFILRKLVVNEWKWKYSNHVFQKIGFVYFDDVDHY